VRKFILIDPDEFSPANMSRHVLGMPFVGQNKARAMAQLLQQDFPHIDESEAIPKRFQQLTSRELDAVLDADLVISAGIDFDGDAALDAWRRGLARPPPHLCAWAEAHAIVGHAVLLYGRDSLMGAFDEEERPLFRLTDWPEKGPQFAVEAGCGNIFQPHGAVDLQPTIALAARLALDALLERAGASCRRSWLGELSAVTVLGGTPRPEFNASNVAREFQWS